MVHTFAAAMLLLSLAAVAALPRGFLESGGMHRSMHQAPTPQLTQRVVFDPNRGENNKVEDYIANVYIGEVDIAEADPVAAGVGGGVSHAARAYATCRVSPLSVSCPIICAGCYWRAVSVRQVQLF